MPSEPFAALVDWGTSRIRLWVVARDGAVLGESRGEEGMRRCLEYGFARALATRLAAAGGRAGLPVMICGMAGARGAWREAPYLDTPTALARISREAAPVEDAEGDVRILPGVAQRDPAAPNVMRGEETQLLGAVGAGDDAVVCLPGTHCKWVEVRDGAIRRFSTFMTGETFEALTRHTILAQSAGSASFAADHPAFARAVAASLADPAGALARAFEVRAAQLLGFESADDGAAHLSGLLIGAEVGAARRLHANARVTLVASGAIAGLYQAALEVSGAEVRPVDADEAARRGLFAAAAAIWGEGARA
jgi:2-dehydro-3-deoxygalactonokinase